MALSFVFSIMAVSAFAEEYTTADTDIGTLLDNPDAAAILEKHMPGFTTNGQVSMTRALTLVTLKSFAPDMVTDEVLEQIDSDLAELADN
jgi:para-nitrobenzyl esterase